MGDQSDNAHGDVPANAPIDIAATKDLLEALEPVERKLVDCVERGEALDLAGDQPVGIDAMRSWGPSRTVRARVVRDILRGRLAPHPDPHGVQLRGVRIAGRLDLDGVTSAVWLGLYDCLLDEGLRAINANLAGLVLPRCQLEHPHLPALNAHRLTTTLLDLRQTTVTANSPEGAITLSGGAHLGILECTGASVRNESGPALYADGLRVDQDVHLRRDDESNIPFVAVGTGERGAVRLRGAHLGLLNCTGASVHNKSGPALYADRLHVDQDVLLIDGFEAVGAGEFGAVRLFSAHLGLLECAGASVRNESGPALDAATLHVDQHVFLCRDDESNKPFVAVGAGERGAVRLLSAHLGELECAGASMRNESGPALIARRVRVDQKFFLDDFEAHGAGKDAVVDLTDVQVGGALVFKPTQLKHHTNPHALIDVDGLVYTGLPQGISTDEWLRLLHEGTRDYAAQPYQLLATAHRAAGHESQARRILMAQRRDQIHRHALSGRAERAWARFTGLTLGYGYQPWRALIGLLVVVGIAVITAVILGGQGGLTQVRTSPPPTPLGCTVVERIEVGLNLGTPLISTGTRARCETTDTTTGQVLTITGWALHLLAWALATLFIAGFTGAVRKT